VSWDLDCGAGVHREVPDRWSTAETDPRGGYLGRLSGSNSAAARSAVLWHGLLAIGNGGRHWDASLTWFCCALCRHYAASPLSLPEGARGATTIPVSYEFSV
jgi:hypothetical protein